MRVIRCFAGATQTVTFNRLRENHRRLALVSNCFSIGCVDFVRIVTAAIEVHNLLVGHILNQLEKLWILTKEVFPGVGAAVKLVVLQLAVTHFVHAFNQQAALVFFQ